MSELDIPESWAQAKLSDLGVFVGGMTPSKQNDRFWSGKIPWVSPKDMKRTELFDSIDHITDYALDSTNIKLIPCDSLLFVIRGMILIHSFPVALSKTDLTINQDMKALLPFSEVYSKYILWAMKAAKKEVLQVVKTASHGTKRIEPGTLENWTVALPPLGEQHRIVTKIESTFKQVESIEQATQTAEALLIKYRNSLLSKAFRGDLVPQDPKDEPASKLIERIRAERAKANTGKKRKDELPPITEEEIPFEIPASWKWVRLGELVHLQNGYSFKQSEWSTHGLPIVRIQNLNRNGGGEFNYFKGIPEESWTVHSGDLLFAWSGSKGVSFGAHFWNGPKAVLNQHIFKVSAPNGVDKSYLYWLLRQFQTQIEDHAHGFKETFVHVKQSDLKLVVVPLPPFAEQSRIVKAIATLLGHLKANEDSWRQISLAAKQLRASISTTAFSGRLVSQDASEGTGYDLLKKIIEQKVPPQNAKPNSQSRLQKPKMRKLLK